MIAEDHVSIGRCFESAACKWLEEQGIATVERNYTVKGGEIDIIGDDNGTIAFIEVKSRKESNTKKYGRPSAAVNDAKMDNLIYAAEEYVRRTGKTNCKMRFDVLEIYYSEECGLVCLRFKYYKSAFTKNH